MKTIRIKQNETVYVLCIGYKKELGAKTTHPEPFLFFTPEMPKRREQECVMLAFADAIITRMKGRPRSLVAAKVIEFLEYEDTLLAKVDFSDVFELQSEAWKQNLTMLAQQGRSIRQRLQGEVSQAGTSWRSYLKQKLSKRRRVQASA